MSEDRIDIMDLALRTIIGIYEEERNNRQDVILNLSIFRSTAAAAASDSIEDAVNYKAVTKRVIDLVEGSSFFLIETLAEKVAELILREFEVPKVTVQLSKPGALRYTRTVQLTITRTSKDSLNR